ncbi:small multidrug resistance protein (plasmid) [Calothrix sp. NIES-4071]|nr:small multidrug resistance protein [Calothrix sp. NIES-4071]BAZ65007.1 small multidrug resistance protein [Calothrix sp. NIES-4105]
MSSWIYLLLGIVFEVTGTTFMKYSAGFSKFLPSVFIFVFYILSISSVNIALKKIDVSIAYAIWSGVGTSLIALIGILCFKETFSISKFLSIVLIIIGIVTLNLSGTTR